MSTIDNVVIQVLVGLVFILLVTIWSKSSTSTPALSEKAAAKAKKRKKSKASAAVTSPHLTSAPEDSSDTRALRLHDQLTPKESNIAADVSPAGKAAGLNASNARQDQQSKQDGLASISDKQATGAAQQHPVQANGAVEATLGNPSKEQGGWEAVGGRSPSHVAESVKSYPSATSNSSWAKGNPFALLPGSGAEPETKRAIDVKEKGGTSLQGGFNPSAAPTLTKKQRQNAAKNSTQKRAKEGIEAERLATLAQHRRQRDLERYQQQASSRPTAKWSKTATGQQGSAAASSLARASINERGALVWD